MNTEENKPIDSNPYALENSPKKTGTPQTQGEGTPTGTYTPTPEGESGSYEEPKKLRTFEDDIAEAVKGGGGSLARIAIAEQGKKEILAGIESESKSNKLFIALGVLFIVGALGAVGFVFYKQNSSVALQITGGKPVYEHPYLHAEAVTPIPVEDIFPRNGAYQSLAYSLNTSDLSPHSVLASIPLTVGTTSEKVSIDKDYLFSKIGKRAPETLTRNLDRNIALGVYKGDDPAPYLILKTNSYENAFVGLLKWEPFMAVDLFKIFGVTLPENAAEKAVSENSNPFGETLSNATTSPSATSSNATTSPISETPTPTRDVKVFVDRTIKNKDVRVIQDLDGKIYFMYGFVNRNTILFTTTPEAYFEIISRLK